MRYPFDLGIPRMVFIILSASLLMGLSAAELRAQNFYLGNDLSYVNEMEDCGVLYKEDNTVRDVYDIFSEHGANAARYRLWHTPSWYDELNAGKRYSDLPDVTKSLARARNAGFEFLLDFHLSDNWADPAKQLVPAAWLGVVDNLPVLQDSLYNYIFNTLEYLADQDLLPEMVQIGNETNKGILLSPEDNQSWTLDWPRNAALFNTAIAAVREIEQSYNRTVRVMLHVADPDNTEWLLQAFVNNGVTDFDMIGMSYYWGWHQPTTISDAADVIRHLRDEYPDKEIVIVETGYPWTMDWNDNASNIINDTHEDYEPVSPSMQKKYLVDLTKAVAEAGGHGVFYWEPAWVSSPCYTQWGQGSHQEHVTFFDFDNNLLVPGGIEWMEAEYGTTQSSEPAHSGEQFRIIGNSFSGNLMIRQYSPVQTLNYIVSDTTGNVFLRGSIREPEKDISISHLPFGLYLISVQGPNNQITTRRFMYSYP